MIVELSPFGHIMLTKSNYLKLIITMYIFYLTFYYLGKYINSYIIPKHKADDFLCYDNFSTL